MKSNHFLGVFVHPLHVQNEGLDQVFDTLESAGTTAICMIPQVARPAEQGKGSRYPDLHIDGYERILDRPVWGRRELAIETFRCSRPNLELYRDSPYAPSWEPVPSGLDSELPDKMIAEAKKRGMQVHFMFHPLLPPGVRPEDQPRLINGSLPAPPRVAIHACINSPAAEAYGLALARDLVSRYPDIDGLMPDWLEFGAYRLEDHFTCFCLHCERAARERGIDWDLVRKDVRALWDRLHALSPDRLERSRRLLTRPSELLQALAGHPGLLEFLAFKAESVARFHAKIRRQLDSAGFERIGLTARGWSPPWNRSSGMEYRALSEVCAAVAPKLFTFDYSVLPRWYGETLLTWNPGLTERMVLDTLVEWMDLRDDHEKRSFSLYRIPAPEEPHPARFEAYRERLDEVADQVGGRTRFYPFAHAYMPDAQWKRMLSIIRDSRADGFWVQMYGFLSDRKLEILREFRRDA